MKHAEWNREVMNHATIVYQRRHRNWALKRARGGLLLQNGIYVLSDLWEKRAHKAEVEVERLLTDLDGEHKHSMNLQTEVARLKNLSEIYDCNGKRWEDRADSAVQRADKADAANAKLVEAVKVLMVFEDDDDACGTEWHDGHDQAVDNVCAVLKEVE